MKKLIYILFLFTLTQFTIAGNSDKVKLSEKVVTGKVTDNSGETISGAKITIAETGETFFADMEGNFKITLKTDKEYSISVNTMGYQPLVLKSTNLTTFSDLTLKEL
ncbi:MAG: carboxypeptidase-like regulatory domain-containing protein [Bacteroidia bacterium]|nr:carboxypeptidase-like regulatory domain-containing protein [Bacteroidia bacterium]